MARYMRSRREPPGFEMLTPEQQEQWWEMKKREDEQRKREQEQQEAAWRREDEELRAEHSAGLEAIASQPFDAEELDALAQHYVAPGEQLWSSTLRTRRGGVYQKGAIERPLVDHLVAPGATCCCKRCTTGRPRRQVSLPHAARAGAPLLCSIMRALAKFSGQKCCRSHASGLVKQGEAAHRIEDETQGRKKKLECWG